MSTSPQAKENPTTETLIEAVGETPVSTLRTASGHLHVISRYEDNTWDFYPYFPQDNLKQGEKLINWTINLSPDAKLTDSANSNMLKSAKDFIWSLVTTPPEGRKELTMNTIVAKFELLIPLLRWMYSSGISRFRDLDGRTLDYIDFASTSLNDKNPVALSTLQYRLNIIELIFLQRHKISEALAKHPWPNENAVSISGVNRSSTYRRPTTEIIPDKVAAELINTAVKYIEIEFLKVKELQDTFEIIDRNLTGAHRQTVTNARTAAARRKGFRGVYDYITAFQNTRTACYIVIDMFSGIRDSEMMSLETNCISRAMSRDGTTNIVWLKGTIFKTGVREKKWVVPEIVAQAVDVLTSLTASLRKEVSLQLDTITAMLQQPQERDAERQLNKRHHKLAKQQSKLFLTRSSKHFNQVSVISGHLMNINLRKFCHDHKILDGSGEIYRLHAHQFRRTYARFVARAELGDLLQLKEHFGHTSLDMTTYYLEGALDYDLEEDLRNSVLNEKTIRQNEILSSYLLSESKLANGNQLLTQWRNDVRTAANKEEVVARFAGSISLNGTGHSWCVGNAKGAGCGGLCIFEAQLCVDCRFGIIGPEHRPVWAGIRDQQLEALNLGDIGPGGKDRAESILNRAIAVIARIDGESLDENNI